MSRPPDGALARLDRASRTFATATARVAALHEVSLEARPGEVLLLMGPSGSGKTTLLTLLAGLLAPSSGTVELFGRPLGALSVEALRRLRAERIGFVFQTGGLIDALTVRENVALALRYAGRDRRTARARAAEGLERFGLGPLAARFPDRLSPGERQRVALARALANQPPLVLADEPTASIDGAQGATAIAALCEHARAHGGAVVVASHDERVVPAAHRVARLADGRLQSLVPGGAVGDAG